jgi:peptidoglycan/LPS O-acetylase OafA/YrhL
LELGGQTRTISPLSYTEFRERSRMPTLDGVRALAILGVLLHHTRGSPFHRLAGFRGVWLFFVLSGFLITTLALREEDAFGEFSVRAFMIRRAFRIMPLFYLALLTYLLWVSVLQMEPNGPLLWRYFLNYVAYCPEFPIFNSGFGVPFGQAWSLGIEEKFYLAWPIIAFVWLKSAGQRFAVGLMLLGAALLLSARPGPLSQMWGSYCDILIGFLLALCMHDRRGYEYLRLLGRSELTYGVLMVVAVMAVNRLSGTHPGERLFSFACGLAIVALLTNRDTPAKFFATQWLTRIGVWSYAIYLTHPFFFDVWNRIIPPGRAGDYLTLPLTLITDLPLCWALHIYIEEPLIRLGRAMAAQVRGRALRMRMSS